MLTEAVRDLEAAHSHTFANIRAHWKWYEAEPRTQRKTHPWPGASNVVLPVIRTAADATTARFFGLLHGKAAAIWTGRSEDEDFAQRYQGEVVRFMNWAARHEFDTFWGPLDWIREMAVVGGSVMAITWEDRQRHILLPGASEPTLVTTHRGPVWTHWPAERILWEPGQSVRDAEMVVTQTFPTWTELSRMAQLDEGFDAEAIQRAYAHPHLNGSPGAEITADKAMRAGVDSDLQTSRRRIYDRRTLYLDWPILKGLGIRGLEDAVTYQDDKTGKRISVPIWVDLMPDSAEIIRVLPNAYLTHDGNNFFDIYFRKQSGYARGTGLAKILEMSQRGQSSILNQLIDNRTLQNAMSFKTTDPKLREQPITPGQGVLVDDINNTQPFPIPGANQMDMAAIQLLQANGERASGVTDPLMGRESRSGGHPSPATNYLGMMEAGAEMANEPVQILRRRLSEMGLYTASLYQQFDTDPTGRIERVFGGADAARIQSWLFPRDRSLVGNLKLDLVAMSETENPQVAMQKAMMVSQATTMYWGNVMRVVQVLANPQVPQLVKDSCLKAVEVLGRTHQTILEAGDYDKAAEAILTIEGGNDDGIEQLRQLAAQALGPPPGAPSPGGPAGPGASAPPQPGAGAPQGSPNGSAGGPLPPGAPAGPPI